jgi:hypothetical protein
MTDFEEGCDLVLARSWRSGDRYFYGIWATPIGASARELEDQPKAL